MDIHSLNKGFIVALKWFSCSPKIKPRMIASCQRVYDHLRGGHLNKSGSRCSRLVPVGSYCYVKTFVQIRYCNREKCTLGPRYWYASTVRYWNVNMYQYRSILVRPPASVDTSTSQYRSILVPPSIGRCC